jgi:hypothetical protein
MAVYYDRKLLVAKLEPVIHERFWPVDRVKSACMPTWAVGLGPERFERAGGRIWACHNRPWGRGTLRIGFKVAWVWGNPYFVDMPGPPPPWDGEDRWAPAIDEAIEKLSKLMDEAGVRYAVPTGAVT